MTTEIYERICETLNRERRSYSVLDHGATFTSRESAAARGEELAIGGKALLIKADDRFVLAVIRADQKLNSRALQRLLGARSIRFASPEELAEVTGGLVPGSVPPFGQPVLDYPLYLDEAFTANERIAFNAGMLTRSIVMAMSDYLDVARPVVAAFARD